VQTTAAHHIPDKNFFTVYTVLSLQLSAADFSFVLLSEFNETLRSTRTTALVMPESLSLFPKKCFVPVSICQS